jgi:hypothetical protein
MKASRIKIRSMLRWMNKSDCELKKRSSYFVCYLELKPKGKFVPVFNQASRLEGVLG